MRTLERNAASAMSQQPSSSSTGVVFSLVLIWFNVVGVSTKKSLRNEATSPPDIIVSEMI
jgi:predicted alternative tryptophan synthase beta-subunit